MLPDRAFFDLLAEAAAEETLPRFRTGLSVVNKQEGGFDKLEDWALIEIAHGEQSRPQFLFSIVAKSST